MSIRTTLLTVLVCLGALVAGYALNALYQAGGERDHAKAAVTVYHTVNGMIDAADALENEKGSVLLALLNNSPVSADQKVKIDSLRKANTELYENEFKYIEENHSFPKKAEALEKARSTAQQLSAIREKVDNALAQSAAARPQNISGEWSEAVVNHIESVIALAHEIEENLFTPDAVHNLLETKTYSWFVTEALGKQNERISGLIARNTPIPLEEYGVIKTEISHMNTFWGLLEGLMEGEYATPALIESFKKVKTEYDNNYIPALEKVTKAGIQQTQYPFSAQGWSDETNNLIKNIAAFSDVVGEVTAVVAQDRNTSASGGMALSAIFLIIALVFGGLAIYVVNNRVIRRIDAMRRNIQEIKNGNTNIVLDTSGKDEISAISVAVDELRKTVGKAFQQQQMIEDIPVGVIVANPHQNFAVIYTNTANKEGLARINHAAGLNIQLAAGESLASLIKDPQILNQVRDQGQLPKTFRLQLGTDWIDLNCSALSGSDGKYAALMCTWQNVTKQVNLANNFEESVMGVVDLVSSSASQLKMSAQMMADNADKTNHSANIVASAAEEASTNVQTVANSAEELSESIQEIARQVAQSTKICNKAVGEAKSTNDTIQHLADAANKIGEVVGLITEIAGKTNLLALNATIEAARAGDAGKGFAVVASEVKDLANQTAKATDEIAGQINSIQESTTNAVKAIESIGNVIADLNEIATSIASAVEEQGASTREIASNVQQTATGTQEVSSNITDVSKAASETGGAAGEVLSSSEGLAVQSERLRDEVGNFLKQIRVG